MEKNCKWVFSSVHNVIIHYHYCEKLYALILYNVHICVQIQHVGMHRSQYHYIIGSLVSLFIVMWCL